MSVSDTPAKVRQSVDEIIDKLNFRWALDLPKRRGPELESASELARACFGRIKFLCFRPQIDLTNLIDDFAERATQLLATAWVYKPSQERGTILGLPVTKSFVIRSDVISKTAQHGNCSREYQLQLLQLLDGLLKEEEELAKTSDSYQRHPAPSTKRNRATSPHCEMDSGKSYNASKSSQSEPPVKRVKATSSVKKNEAVMTPKIKTRTSSIRDYFHPAAIPLDAANRVDPPLDVPMVQYSFESSNSPPSLEVFTPPQRGSRISSNNTSMMSLEEDVRGDSQYLFATQEMEDICKHPSIKRSFQSFDEGGPVSVFDELQIHGPFKSSASFLPSDLPFSYIYELHRISKALDIKVLALYQQVDKICKTQEPDHETLWKAIRRVAQTMQKSIPEKSNTSAWSAVQNTFTEKPDTEYSAVLSGQLEWTDASTGGYFQFRTNPLRLEKSCRFHRRFGADRFMIVTMPALTSGQVPNDSRGLRNNSAAIFKDISAWLAIATHHILDRKWRTFFIEEDKSKTKKRKETGPMVKVHLFAVDGLGFLREPPSIPPSSEWRRTGRHKPVNIQDFMDWHLCFQDNSHSTDLKLFSRFALGLSKTTSTVVLERDEFIHLPDKQPVMNDGCALMSLKLAQRVAEMLGIEKKTLPSAFQGRVGGAKGLWMVDHQNSYTGRGKRGYWIEITDSQLKIQPQPARKQVADPEQRTFEVCKYSTSLKTAHLSTQLLTILDDREVPRAVLKDLLLTDAKSYSDGLLAAMKNPLSIAAWVQEHHRPPRNREGISWLGGFPTSREEQIGLLLESGFKPHECQILSERLRDCLGFEMSKYVEKLQINVPHSTNVFCVADPYGVLEANEVHFGATDLLENPLNGLCESNLQDLDLLVARLPAYLPSDIQKRRVVYKKELRFYRNVIVFSTKGQEPLASLLSGGDYDGDVVWVCWDASIVKSFQNSPMPKLPSKTECSLSTQSCPLSEVLGDDLHSADGIDQFLINACAFNAQSSLLGTCTHEHERLIYHQREKSMLSQGALTLAALAGYLVDANKQGSLLTRSDWITLRSKVSGKKVLEPPAYKADVAPRNLDLSDSRANVIDFLKFGVAKQWKETALTDFNSLWPQVCYYDKELSKLWNDAKDRADKEVKWLQRPELKNILDQLEKDIKAVGEFWGLHVRTPTAGKSQFNVLVESTRHKIQAVEPLLGVEHDISARFADEKKQSSSHWAALRASCLYYCFNKGQVAWYCAGEELCRMKAEASGSTRLMTATMHNVSKIDVKFARKLAQSIESIDGNEAEDDEFAELEDPANIHDDYLV